MRANVDEDAQMETDAVDAGEIAAPAHPREKEDAWASPRLIPAPESPRRGDDLEISPLQNDVGDPSASFDKKCAP